MDEVHPRLVAPYEYPPRGMSKAEAARYIGVGTTLFDQRVEDGRMPKPKLINSRTVWDRYRLDAAFSDLPEWESPNRGQKVFALL